MLKVLSALMLLLHTALFLVATYVMVQDENGYSFIFALMVFVTLPISIWVLANQLSK